MSKRDPHQVLGVPRSAPVSEIRSAYRGLARQLHPDASGRPETADAFHQATLAYQELCEGASDATAIPVTVAPSGPARSPREPAPEPMRRARAIPAVEELASRASFAEPFARARWRRTEAQDLASDLTIEAEVELLLRLLRAGYFPW
jgi:curved DNA-binding protein CbpA